MRSRNAQGFGHGAERAFRRPRRAATLRTLASLGVPLVAALALATPALAQSAGEAPVSRAADQSAGEDLGELKQELQALRAEEAAARAAEAERARRIDALARALSEATGQPVVEAAAPEVETLPITNPPRSGTPGLSTPGDGYWGAHDPARGFTVASTDVGEMNISGYLLGRWVDQMPEKNTFVDHLGRTQSIDPRDDVQMHRMMLWIRGWVFTPKLRYELTSWAVLSTGQATLIGNINYEVNKAITVGIGLQRNQGSLTMHWSHPYWYASDRVMADEFFRPGLSSAVYVMGEPQPGLRYALVLSPTLSQLGVNAKQLTRNYVGSASLWWMPTTKEFGPREALDDFENHQTPATLFSITLLHGRENAFNNLSTSTPDQTTVRLSDSLQFFSMGALEPGVQVLDADDDQVSLGAGYKYKGFSINAEGFWRKLSSFDSTGPLTTKHVTDTGFYVQSGYYVVPRFLELYGSTSWVFGQYNDSYEFIGGLDWFPMHARNLRFNAQLIYVNKAAVSSTFGYYVGGMTGLIASMGLDMIF